MSEIAQLIGVMGKRVQLLAERADLADERLAHAEQDLQQLMEHMAAMENRFADHLHAHAAAPASPTL